MAKKIAKKTIQQLTSKKLENLLNQQTIIILDAVDEKIGGIKNKIGGLENRFNLLDKEMIGLKKRLEIMEIRINQKIDRLTTTLDKFLKRLTDMEDEFEIMKLDINRLKKIIREKLGF